MTQKKKEVTAMRTLKRISGRWFVNGKACSTLAEALKALKD